MLNAAVDSNSVVLLVDDQLIIAEAVRRLLAAEKDISFHYCSKPEDAVQAATTLLPTVILQDLVMPGMNGLELLRQYRDNPLTSETPIIVLSTKEDPHVKSQAFSEGANDYLVKLPDRIELLARLRYHSKAYRALTELRQQATRDSLTGVWNRKHIFELLGKELARASRDQQPVAVVMSDLDHFKSVNDNYGHPAGDAVLKQAVQRFNSCVRAYDHVGRYGGEEFMVVLPRCNREHAATIAERLRNSIASEPIQAGDVALNVTSSFGVAVSTGAQAEVHDIISAADKALYVAKTSGRNRVQFA
jgi:two-component system, chemotaxis family, response regulator WspR